MLLKSQHGRAHMPQCYRDKDGTGGGLWDLFASQANKIGDFQIQQESSGLHTPKHMLAHPPTFICIQTHANIYVPHTTQTTKAL